MTTLKLRPIWRVAIGIVGVLMALATASRIYAAQTIVAFYLHDHSYAILPLDIAVALVAGCLMWVSAPGRWPFRKRAGRPVRSANR